MPRITHPPVMEVQTGLPDVCRRTNCPDRRPRHHHPVVASEVRFLEDVRRSSQESDGTGANGSDLARYNSHSSTALSHPAYNYYTHLPPPTMQPNPTYHPTHPQFLNPWGHISDATIQGYGRLESDRRFDLSERLPSISDIVGAPRGRSPVLPPSTNPLDSSYYNYRYSRRQSPGAARRHARCYGTPAPGELGRFGSAASAPRPRIEGPATAPPPEQSYYDFICAGEPQACRGEQNIRKSVSHFFGRNKSCTKNITKDMWVLYCRKHYQRGRYNAQKEGIWGTVQHDQLVAQMEKFDRYFTCDNWEVKYSCGLKKAVDIFAVFGDRNAEGIPENFRNTVTTAHAMRGHLGRGKNNQQVWALIMLMKMVQREFGVTENVHLEFLPHGLQRRSDAPIDPCPTATAPSGSPLAPNPRPRTNRAALNGSGRHSSTRQPATPSQASVYQPDLARAGIPELTLPQLGSSRTIRH